MKKLIAVSLSLQTLIFFYFLGYIFLEPNYKFDLFGSLFLISYVVSMVLFFYNSKNNFESEFLYNLLIFSSFLNLVIFIIFNIQTIGSYIG
jgi:hypothetical protein